MLLPLWRLHSALSKVIVPPNFKNLEKCWKIIKNYQWKPPERSTALLMPAIAAINWVILSRIAPKLPINGAPFLNVLLLLLQPPPTWNSPPPTAVAVSDYAKFGSPWVAVTLAANTTVAPANMYAIFFSSSGLYFLGPFDRALGWSHYGWSCFILVFCRINIVGTLNGVMSWGKMKLGNLSPRSISQLVSVVLESALWELRKVGQMLIVVILPAPLKR